MKIVDFVLRGNLPLKEGESYMDECALLRSACREIFPLHDSIIGAGGAEWDSVPFIVGTHSKEIRASDNSPFEMEYVGRVWVFASGLMMIAELIQPRERVRIGAAVVT